MSKLKNKIAAYEMRDYDARDLMNHLNKELNLDEINHLLGMLEIELDFKQYPALNTFFYSINEIKQELETIKEYVNK